MCGIIPPSDDLTASIGAPIIPALASICASKTAPVAQLDRVPGYELGGRGFESLRARQLNWAPSGAQFSWRGGRLWFEVLGSTISRSEIGRRSEAQAPPQGVSKQYFVCESIPPGAPTKLGPRSVP